MNNTCRSSLEECGRIEFECESLPTDRIIINKDEDIDSLSSYLTVSKPSLAQSTGKQVLKVCARMAVARGDAVYNSPIFETEVKGGAYSVTLHLYRRAIAGAIALDLSLHKRSRLHFVRGSRGESARVAEEAKNHFETGRCSDSDGFSARHSSREYGYYEQFRGFRSGPERHYE